MGDNGSVGDRTAVVSGTVQLANVGDVLLAGQLQANWSSLAGGNGTREVIPSSINSSQAGSQGSISSTVVDNFANGSNGGSTTVNNTIVDVFPVPAFSGLMSGCFFDVSTGLVGMVGSLDAGARPLLVSPATGSFVFGPYIHIVYTYVFIYIYKYRHYTYGRRCIHIYKYIYIYKYMYVYVYMYLHKWVDL